jgi:hypothetical protein
MGILFVRIPYRGVVVSAFSLGGAALIKYRTVSSEFDVRAAVNIRLSDRTDDYD